MRKIPCVYMRGGTSKGAVFLQQDLPYDRKQWEEIFLKVMGSPDPKQIDGLGGCVSSNNKIVVIKKSEREGVDIDYTVAQVIPDKSQVDYKSNCGNMSSVVGPYAIDEGLIPAIEPFTKVALYNTNTDAYLDIYVPVENGKFKNYGDCEVAGVLGTSAEMKLAFKNPAGVVTGNLFPTGNLIDTLNIPDFGDVEATIIDVSNPLILVNAESIGLTGTEMPDDINGNKSILNLIEKIRGISAQQIGMTSNWRKAETETPAIPKIAFLTSPKRYNTLTNDVIEAKSHDICGRIISVGKLHKAYVLTAASATAVAAKITNTVANKIVKNPEKKSISVGHPSGVIEVFPNMKENVIKTKVDDVQVIRTARRIMDGFVYIK